MLIENRGVYISTVSLELPSESTTDGDAVCIGCSSLYNGKPGLESPIAEIKYSDDHFDFRTSVNMKLHIRVPLNNCEECLKNITGDLVAEVC